MSLANRVVVLTGAGGGIGRVIAGTLIGEGALLAIADISEADVNAVAGELRMRGEVAGFAVDIAVPDSVEALKDKVMDRYGHVDILVNAAGIQGPIGEFEGNEIADWIRTVNVNLIGTVICCKAFVPAFKAAKAGKIINFAGGGANAPRPCFSAYGTSKAGVVRFTETLAVELKDHNIQVNAISPGIIKTRMIEETLSAGPERAGGEFEQVQKRMSSGFDDPRNAAELVAFLASESSNWLTGRNISAVWDPWREWMNRPPEGLDKDLYVLRRIDDRNFKKA